MKHNALFWDPSRTPSVIRILYWLLVIASVVGAVLIIRKQNEWQEYLAGGSVAVIGPLIFRLLLGAFLPRDRSAPEDERYRGVDGWLLIFALFLVAFQPIAQIVSIGIAWDGYRVYRLLDSSSGRLAGFGICLALAIGAVMALWGFLVGTAIFREQPAAKERTANYIFCRLFAGLIGSMVLFISVASLSDASRALPVALVGGISAVISFFILSSFWSRSRRVRYTFMSQQDREALALLRAQNKPRK